MWTYIYIWKRSSGSRAAQEMNSSLDSQTISQRARNRLVALTSTLRLRQASRPSIVRTPCPCKLRRVNRWPGLAATAHADRCSRRSPGAADTPLPPQPPEPTPHPLPLFEPGGMPRAGADGCILKAFEIPASYLRRVGG